MGLNRAKGNMYEFVTHTMKPKTNKRCSNCDESLSIGTPSDPNRRHHCDSVTSGRIKTESECEEQGYKYFFPKEYEEEGAAAKKTANKPRPSIKLDCAWADLFSSTIPEHQHRKN
jgi:hypothetical protein